MLVFKGTFLFSQGVPNVNRAVIHEEELGGVKKYKLLVEGKLFFSF